MGCLPESGGCERGNIEPFIGFLNEMEGHQFTFLRCLDVTDRSTKQPEILYRDDLAGTELVVERKSLVWPKGAVAEHRNEHILADELSRQLGDCIGQHPVDIEIWQVGRMSRLALSETAQIIVRSVRSSLHQVLHGQMGGSRTSEPRWVCRFDPYGREANGEPPNGLIIRFLAPDSYPDLEDSRLHAEVHRLLQSVSEKFQSHSTRRRILLLDPFGSLRSIGREALSHLLGRVTIPSLIPEIWRASYDWVTDDDEGWMFEKILPVQAHAAS